MINDDDDLVRAYIARGGMVRVCDPAPRPDQRKLERTGAETFFASLHVRRLSKRERDDVARGLLAK